MTKKMTERHDEFIADVSTKAEVILNGIDPNSFVICPVRIPGTHNVTLNVMQASPLHELPTLTQVVPVVSSESNDLHKTTYTVTVSDNGTPYWFEGMYLISKTNEIKIKEVKYYYAGELISTIYGCPVDMLETPGSRYSYNIGATIDLLRLYTNIAQIKVEIVTENEINLDDTYCIVRKQRILKKIFDNHKDFIDCKQIKDKQDKFDSDGISYLIVNHSKDRTVSYNTCGTIIFENVPEHVEFVKFLGNKVPFCAMNYETCNKRYVHSFKTTAPSIYAMHKTPCVEIKANTKFVFTDKKGETVEDHNIEIIFVYGKMFTVTGPNIKIKHVF